MVCGAKRIRSLYLPWITAVTPKLSTPVPYKGLASLDTINAAITPWRDAFAEQTSLLLLSRAVRSRPHSVPPYEAWRSERRTAI